MGVFTRSVLAIPTGKILDKNCESSHWWQTFRLSSNVYTRSGLYNSAKRPKLRSFFALAFVLRSKPK